MEMSGDGTSSIRVIPFGGKTTEWSVWAEKFLARGRKKGYKDILLGKTNVPSAIDADDDEVTLSEEDKKTRELNEEACIDLILSINGETEAGRGRADWGQHRSARAGRTSSPDRLERRCGRCCGGSAGSWREK